MNQVKDRLSAIVSTILPTASTNMATKNSDTGIKASDLPSFKDMPAVKGMPQGCAWGLFDKNGKRDNLGTINLLTPEVAIESRSEIKTGESVALNWSMDHIHEPGFTREKLQHNFKDLKPLGFISCDDIISVNTQAGSQWDGLRHWGHQKTELYYNNLKHDEILKSKKDGNWDLRNGTHHWSEHGGFVGRGVLIDYHDWATRNNIDHPATKRSEISVKDVETVAKEQGVEFKPADLLIIRSGFIDWYNKADDETRISGANKGHEFIGVNGCEETITWLWDHHFSAVAGDAIAFEAWPTKFPWSE